MFQQLRPAASMLLAFSIVAGMLYPAVVTAISQAVFPFQSNGSLLEKEDTIVGSELIGQNFTSAHYFWSRLSATSPDPYNAAASSGSNLGPMNKLLVEAVRNRADALRGNETKNEPIPVDLVTASGSGLDPHISINAALFQIKRIAAARGMEISTLEQLVEKYTEPRQFGFLGEPRINVLKLNLELDRSWPLNLKSSG